MARDPLGRRPLFYAIRPNLVIASSVLSVLHQLLPGEIELNEIGLKNFLRFGRIGVSGETAYKDVYRLEPGHFARLFHGNVGSVVSAPRFDVEHVRSDLSLSEASKELRARLRQSVSLHLQHDGGALAMSGGVDSTALAAASVEDGGSQKSLTLHTWAYKAAAYAGENEFSISVARSLGLEQQLHWRDEAELFSGCDEQSALTPEPYAGAFTALDRETERSIAHDTHLMLFGHGADDLFFKSAGCEGRGFMPWVYETLDPGFTGVKLQPRFPFLDVPVRHWIRALPAALLEDKLVLREAFSDALPDRVRYRPKAIPPVKPHRISPLIPTIMSELVEQAEKIGGLVDIADVMAITQERCAVYAPGDPRLLPLKLLVWLLQMDRFTKRTPLRFESADDVGPSTPC